MPQTPEPQTYTLPPSAPFANHGRTKAAWVLMWAVCLGVLLAGLGMMLNHSVVMIVGIVLALGGVVVSLVMRGMGLGQPAHASVNADERDWYSA